MFKVPVAEGRFISDLDGYGNFCVLGHTKAEWLRQQGVPSPVGAEVVFGGRVYTVVGVAGPVLAGSFRPYEINEGIMIPIRLALRLPDRPRIGVLAARMIDSGETVAATRQLKEYFQYTDRMNVDVVSAEDLVAQMERQMRMFTLMLGAIGSIALIVGGVGVMNVMLVSVSERRREIGIRRAIGAEQKDIQFQFLIESVVLSFVGGLIGLVLGVGTVAVICTFTGWEFFVSIESVLLGVGVSAAVGIFFGYYPQPHRRTSVGIAGSRSGKDGIWAARRGPPRLSPAAGGAATRCAAWERRARPAEPCRCARPDRPKRAAWPRPGPPARAARPAPARPMSGRRTSCPRAPGPAPRPAPSWP